MLTQPLFLARALPSGGLRGMLITMFTGIVEGVGRLVSLQERAEAWRLVVEAGALTEGLALGDSLACNGCCLTVVDNHDGRVGFDLLEETLRKTSLGSTPVGGVINLERALAAQGRLGGHFVSGHIDGLGTITTFEVQGKNHYLRVRVPPEFTRYIVYKGSVALDGISLTIAEEHPDGLAVWLIPHTVAVTNLHQRRLGDPLNLEFDLLAKYAEKILQGRDSTPHLPD